MQFIACIKLNARNNVIFLLHIMQPRCIDIIGKRCPYDHVLLLLTHGLVSFKLLYGLFRYALSAFVPPSVIPNLQKNTWRGQAIKQICE
jgi:hypothetical protein